MNSIDGMPLQLVEDASQFEQLCKVWSTRDYLAFDTEFVRTNTFYANIGLLQIADEDACYLIDPFKIDDWRHFVALLEDSECTFVIHSCSEDLNLLHTFLGCVPSTIFDTQLAAAFLGIGFSVSYQFLVGELLDIAVAKDETRSNWVKRPLSENQLIYAATDVRHLLALQSRLQQKLIDKGSLKWFEMECKYQVELAAEYEVKKKWETIYAGLSNSWRLNDLGLHYLQKLCYWREQESRNRNKPRSWIAKDSDLFGIADQLSNSEEPSVQVLMTATQLDKKIVGRYGAAWVEMLLADEPHFEQIDRSLLNTPLAPSLRRKLKACQQVVREKAAELLIAPELLGRKKQLLELIRSFERSGALAWAGELSGWRRDLLESEFNRIMASDL